MKKTFAIASMALIAMASCTNPTGYTINGVVSDSTMNGKTIYLTDINGEPIDSAVIENSAFKFAKAETLAKPTCLTALVGRTRATILVEEGTVANVNFGRLSDISDNGGLNDKWAAIIKSGQEKGAKITEVYNTLKANNVSDDSIKLALDAIRDEIFSMYTTALNENKDNILGAYIFTAISREYTELASFDSIVATIKYANEFPVLKNQRESLVAIDNSKAGKMFIDFDGKNIDGTPAKLSDHVGKGQYVLVDFWASWCGPCRAEIPNLVSLEKQFGGKNFKVLGVNVWDSEAEFKKAIEKEGINYAQLYASENKEATALYGISGIPQIILFAPDGTIVKRDLRGEEMIAFVTEQLAK